MFDGLKEFLTTESEEWGERERERVQEEEKRKKIHNNSTNDVNTQHRLLCNQSNMSLAFLVMKKQTFYIKIGYNVL